MSRQMKETATRSKGGRKTRPWREIKNKGMTPEHIGELDRKVEAKLVEMDLRAIRELLGVTQVELAKAAEIAQPEVSRMERRRDYRLSTLRRYVEALGGELDIEAVFGDKRVRLRAIM